MERVDINSEVGCTDVLNMLDHHTKLKVAFSKDIVDVWNLMFGFGKILFGGNIIIDMLIVSHDNLYNFIFRFPSTSNKCINGQDTHTDFC